MSSPSPMVSVITPTFNRAHFLEECLHSILRQTYPYLEAIVIDDGSTDGTRSLVEQMQQQDGRIRYVSQPNGGVSSARNTGLKHAQGEFIALLDSDDIWHPWKLEAQVAALQALPESGMVWTDMSAIDSRGQQLHDRYLRKMYGAYRKLGPQSLFADNAPSAAVSIPGHNDKVTVRSGMIYSQMLFGNLVHTSTVLLRRERALAAGPFNERFRRGGEDYAFHLNTCRLGPVAFLDLPSIDYRIGCADQITANRKNQVEFATAFLETIQNQLSQHSEFIHLSRRDIHSILSDAYAWMGTELRYANQPLPALTQLLQAVRHQPGNRYAWMQMARACMPGPVRDCLKKWLSPLRTQQTSPASA
ncbi:glycosyltransferase family 2 protein [Planctomicrobium sp. SH664]|uniref:glycosyltransferase family 2 protein n=1 Tax=Planctomicrobium sp. SH664 TaxID=3448125 RepID=UPI003F5BEDCB